MIHFILHSVFVNKTIKNKLFPNLNVVSVSENFIQTIFLRATKRGLFQHRYTRGKNENGRGLGRSAELCRDNKSEIRLFARINHSNYINLYCRGNEIYFLRVNVRLYIVYTEFNFYTR